MKDKIELSDGQLALFCEQVHLILSSSIGLADGMDSIIEGFSNPAQKERLGLLKGSLEAYNSVSSSMELTGLFPTYMINMVEVGEKSGKTDQVMESLASYYDKQHKLKKDIRSATTYPMVIALMVMVVITVLVVKVLPIFSDVFANLGGNIPASVDLVTKVSRVLVSVLALAFFLSSLLVGGLLVRNKSVEGRKKNRIFLTKLPGIKKLYYSVQTAQFANSLSLLVSSGYDLHGSLEMVGKTIEEETYKEKILDAIQKLEKGESLAEVLEQMKIFKGLHGQMIKLAVQTGHLDSVLGRMADEYTDDVERGVEKMIGIIEPSLVGATAFIIGGILLTVMLPLLGIMSTIG